MLLANVSAWLCIVYMYLVLNTVNLLTLYSRTKVHAYGTTHMISLTLISNWGKQDTNFPNKRKMHCHRVKITSKTNF